MDERTSDSGGASPAGAGEAVDPRQPLTETKEREIIIAEIQKIIDQWGKWLAIRSANDYFALQALHKALHYLKDEQRLVKENEP